MTVLIYFPKGTVSYTWCHSINACGTELNASQCENRAKGAVSPSELLSPRSVGVFLLLWCLSVHPTKEVCPFSTSQPGNLLQLSHLLRIELTSMHLPRQMAPFPCLCLSRIYKHVSMCPDQDMHGRIQGSRFCVNIRRGPNSPNELGRSVPLYHFAFFFVCTVGGFFFFFGIQILCSRSFASPIHLQNSSQIFQVSLNKAVSENWKDFFNLSFIFDLTILCNHQSQHHRDSEIKAGVLL